jgi:hypothetical protein
LSVTVTVSPPRFAATIKWTMMREPAGESAEVVTACVATEVAADVPVPRLVTDTAPHVAEARRLSASARGRNLRITSYL